MVCLQNRQIVLSKCLAAGCTQDLANSLSLTGCRKRNTYCDVPWHHEAYAYEAILVSMKTFTRQDYLKKARKQSQQNTKFSSIHARTKFSTAGKIAKLLKATEQEDEIFLAEMLPS